MATNDMQTFLPLLQQQVPVAPTAAPTPAPSANPTLRRALIEPTPVAPPQPITADSLRASLAALQPFFAQAAPANLPAAQNAAAPAPAGAVATPPAIVPSDVTPPSTAPATVSTPSNPATAPQQPLRAGTPRVGRDAVAPITVGSAAVAGLPGFAPGTPDLSQVPNSATYNDAGQQVGGRNGQGVEIIRNGVSSTVGGGGPSMLGGRFINPGDAIANGYAQQLAYQQASLNNLLAAFRNSDGLAATKHALAQTIGLNNFGSVQGQGVNTVNSAIGNIAAAGAGANASMYGSTLGYLSREHQLGFEQEQAQNTPVQIGAEVTGIPDGKGGVIPTMALPTYGLRGKGGAAPTPINPSGARTSKPQEGATGTYQGRPVVYTNGSWAYKQ